MSTDSSETPQGISSADLVMASIARKATEKIHNDRDLPVASREARLLRFEREQVNSIREGIAIRREENSSTFASIEQSQMYALSFIPEEHQAIREQAKEKLRENLLLLQGNFTREQLAHQDTLEMAIGASLEAYFDTNTALFARKAMIKACSNVYISEHQKNFENKEHEKYKVYFEIGDGMLFHAGNELRSASGFDDALRSETRAQIAIARYFSKDYSPYNAFSSEDEAIEDPDFKRFVLDVESNRKLFEELRDLDKVEGNSLEYYEVRMNAGGGDEFLRMYHVKGADSQKMLSLARKLTIGITNSQVLAPEYDVLTGQDRELSDKEKDRRWEIAHGVRKSPDAFKVAYGKDSALLRQFLEFYGEHLMTQVGEPIIQNPRYDVCFDMAIYERDYDDSERQLPTFDDAIMHFITGTDSEKHRLKKGNGDMIYGLYNEKGQPDDVKISAYAGGLADRVRTILQPIDYNNPTKVQDTIRDLVLDDIVSSYADFLNDQVNAVAKPIKKYNVLQGAYLHKNRNPQDLFAIGATVATGRPKFLELSNTEKAELTIQLIKDFEEECASNPDSESLKHASEWWINLKQTYISTPNKDGVLPDYQSVDDINYDSILADYTESAKAEKRKVQRAN